MKHFEPWPKTPPTLQLRRDLVQALIQFANKSQGGVWSLVSCAETERFTFIELESDYYVHNLAGEDQPPMALRRFRVIVEPAYAHAAGADVVNVVRDDTVYPNTDPHVYCRRCDVFIGNNAIGVVRPPEGMSDKWLANHCWLCKRSREEIVAAEQERQ